MWVVKWVQESASRLAQESAAGLVALWVLEWVQEKVGALERELGRKLALLMGSMSGLNSEEGWDRLTVKVSGDGLISTSTEQSQP